jgi:predicted transcriptional regulator
MTMAERMSDLGELEHEVMQLVWSGGEVTAEDIREKLDRKPKESTVRTVLRRLEDKGYLSHTMAGRTFVFSAR